MRLLGEMAMDLGFGIETLRLREKEAATREALQRSNEDLEERVAARTAALAQSNRELEAFSYSASHDLRAPLRSIAGFAEIVHEDYGHLLDAEGRSHLDRIRRAAIRMGQLIDDLLQLARVSQAEVNKVPVILSELARDVFAEVASATPGRSVKVGIEEGLAAEGDPVLLRVALQNLLENAWKYSGQRADAEIAFGALALPDGQLAYFVRDNGSGFDMAQAGRLFQPFVRLHGGEEYPGTGIGLATVARVIERHGGRIWAEAEKDKGATFFFTLD
jgi:light-regulated signal transduction histidine kinase (bacteriophytochrome)